MVPFLNIGMSPRIATMTPGGVILVFSANVLLIWAVQAPG